MKTRRISTKIWMDSWFVSLPRASKLVFIYLITSQHMGLSGYAEIPDRVICFETNTTQPELLQAKEDLKEKVSFYKDWVLLKNLSKHDPIKGEKNSLWKPYNEEIDKIPQEIRDVLDGGSTPPQRVVNGGNGIGKGNGRVKEREMEEEEFEKIAKKYNVPMSFVLSKWDDVQNWEAEKPGRMKGRNWKMTLTNWVKRDAIKIINNKKGKVFDATK